MGSFQIEGGHRLRGNITPQGAKNEALQILCAVLLTKKPLLYLISRYCRCQQTNAVAKKMGVKVASLDKGKYAFTADNVDLNFLETQEYKTDAKQLRGSVMLVGPMLSNYGMGSIPRPGGDKIGRRRLDTHFEGLKLLGAQFNYNKEDYFYNVTSDQLKGHDILLEEASVTGTANILMAAVLAQGTTTIYNAACEPYLQQLCKMLNSMGAKISGLGSNLLTIEGVSNLSGTEHNILPDMVEIGSWIGLAAMTKSEITIKDVSWANLGQIPNVFSKLGIQVQRKGDDIYIPSHHNGYEIQSYIDGSILTVSDSPWPGFTPDLLSIVLVIATQARGSVLIHQKMFESRLFFVDKLIDMGAKIILCDPHRATVIGHDFKSQLKATVMTSPDIRAGISLLIAALSAKGTSTIHNIEQIDRGYENIEERLKAIGAKITRLQT